MKIRYIYVVFFALSLMLYSCKVEMQTYDLADEYATSLHYQGSSASTSTNQGEEESAKSNLVGVPARNFYSGDLKRGAIWWASKGVTLDKGEVFDFNVIHIGADSIPWGSTNPSIDLPGTPFGATFPPLDLIKDPVMLKISARAEGQNGTSPTLYLQLGDADGYQTNAKRPYNKIENSADFQDYYFDLQDIYMQNEPKKHKVNGALITGLQFFINPGQAEGYTGKILIKEVKIVAAPAKPKP